MEKEVNLAALLTKLDFAPENIIQAACTNSNLFVEAAKYRVRCLENKVNAKTNWEVKRAERELAIRKKARDTGEKTTEDQIKAQLLVDKIVMPFAKALSQAEVHDTFAGLVVEAFRMRRDCLQVVKGLVQDEYSMSRAAEDASGRMRKVREDLRKKFPGSEDSED